MRQEKRFSSWKVSKEDVGIKLIDFLEKKLLKEISNKAIKKQIELGRAALNKVVERFASTKVCLNDVVTFDHQTLLKKSQPVVFDKKKILFENDNILVYNKPSGVSSELNGLLSLLAPYGTFFLVHRLDKDTSGAIILAKSSKIAETLMEGFKKREVVKEYLALVHGSPKEIEGVIENYLGKISSFSGQTLYGKVPANKGLPAKTSWNLFKTSKRAALLKCYPETGRTHQIRVHLSQMGHPILADPLYGTKVLSEHTPERLMLHAYKITFKDPSSNSTITVEAPIPLDFKRAMDLIWE